MLVGVSITILLIIGGAISLNYILKVKRDWKLMKQINEENDLKYDE